MPEQAPWLSADEVATAVDAAIKSGDLVISDVDDDTVAPGITAQKAAAQLGLPPLE